MYQKLIKEICHELNIKYKVLSKKWIIRLEKEDKVRYLSGNKFDLNGHAIGNMLDDKYAFYDTLKYLGIPVCEHKIFYHENNQNRYAVGCHTKDDLLKLFDDYNHNIVIKPNKGSMGIGVYHITNKSDLLEKVKLLLTTNYSISICPFYHIKNEYRVVILDNEIKLMFKKINPVIIGDGKRTLKELLLKFNRQYYKDKEIPEIVLDKGKVYTYDFKFNLSRGSIASTDIEPRLKEKIAKLALNVTKKVGITFASIDIIETEDNKLLVMEANSGVTINKVTNFMPNGRNVAKEIYKEAILKLFK